MGTGQNVAILRDDNAGTGAALNVAAAKPDFRTDHLLGGDCHHTGLDDGGNILNGECCSRRAALRGGVFIPLDGLYNDLAAGQTGAGCHNRTQHTAAKAQRHNSRHRCHTGPNLFMVLLFRLGGLLRCAGITVPVISAVCAIAAAAKIAGVAALAGSVAVLAGSITILVPLRIVRGSVIILLVLCVRGRIIGAGRVGGIHAAAAHIGIAAVLLVRLLGLPSAVVLRIIMIKTRVIIFAHKIFSFNL